jgi:hypothetical protein
MLKGKRMPFSKIDLDRTIAANNLHIAPFRDDGASYGTPTWIWCVAVDGALYVRGERSSPQG